MRTQVLRTAGFTLFELMLVVTIVGILAAVAVPSYQDYMRKARITEGFSLSYPARTAVAEYYDRWGRLPADNRSAGLPAPEQLGGRVVASITVAQGAVQVALRDDAGLQLPPGIVLLLRPAINRAHPAGPLVWVCGATTPPPGFTVADTKLTLVPNQLLPGPCRQ